MPFFDLPLEELQTYLPPRPEPDDFDAFWATTLDEARRFPLNAAFTPMNYGLRLVDTYDVTFNGYGGQPIKGWLIMPRAAAGASDTPRPCVVEYIGYGGGRGYPHDWLVWAAAGYAHLIMDTRGQGSAWRNGDTPDLETEGGNPQFPGFMTRGILDPKTYYYRRVFTDAVRAVEAARSFPGVDTTRIAVTGGSQGGGITLAAAGLDRSISAALPDVPFLCHFRRATTFTDSAPYSEIAKYLQIHRDKVSAVFSTLRYFDGMNFAARAAAASLFSVGLMDEICPPSTVYAAYNHYAGPKQIAVYEFNHHEGGATHHLIEKIKFLQKLWGE